MLRLCGIRLCLLPCMLRTFPQILCLRCLRRALRNVPADGFGVLADREQAEILCHHLLSRLAKASLSKHRETIAHRGDRRGIGELAQTQEVGFDALAEGQHAEAVAMQELKMRELLTQFDPEAPNTKIIPAFVCVV
jgi:hypothetical protein